jgi:hypothetical protein
MRLDKVKKLVVGAAFGFMVLFSAGIMFGTTAQAQDRDRDRRGGEWRQQQNRERSRDWDRGRDRDRDWRRDRGRVFVAPAPRVFVYPRTYPYYGRGYGYGNGYGYGGYGNGGYGYGGYGYGGSGSYEEQRGYRDGLDRGQEDARSGRSPNPNNSSHYRSGDSAYRDGFRRGYAVGFRQFGGYRGW